MRRALAVTVAVAAMLLVLALPAGAKVLNLRFPRFIVPPHSDREVCNFVRLPGKKPMDIAGTVIRNVGGKEGFVSHHFLMWAYQGTNAAVFPECSELQNGEACFDFAP